MGEIKKFFMSLWQSLVYYTRGLYHRLGEENVFFLASGVAFNGILCLLPMLLLITSLIGIMIHLSVFPMQKIDDVLNTIFPPQPYAQQIKYTIIGIINDIEKYRSAFGYAGIVLLIWASASMFGSIRVVLNRIYHLKSKKFVLFTYIENLIFVIILGGMFLTANLLSWIFLSLESVLKKIPELGFIDFPLFTQMVTIVGSYLIAFLMFYGMNRFLPGEKIPTRVAAIASFTTTTLWWLAGKVFAWYLIAFQPYTKLYGTYTVIFVFFLWIYYSSAAFVIGVVVGQLFRERHSLILK